jgi:hypothetical protein
MSDDNIVELDKERKLRGVLNKIADYMGTDLNTVKKSLKTPRQFDENRYLPVSYFRLSMFGYKENVNIFLDIDQLENGPLTNFVACHSNYELELNLNKKTIPIHVVVDFIRGIHFLYEDLLKLHHINKRPDIADFINELSSFFKPSEENK